MRPLRSRPRPRRAGFSAAWLVAAFGLLAAFGPASAEGHPSAARYLYGIPDGLDLERLVGAPELLDSAYYAFEAADGGEPRLSGYADVAAVYDIPLDRLAAVAADFPSYPRFMPRILGVEVLGVDGSASLLRYRAGLDFLFISVAFESVFESTVDALPGGAVGVRSRLVESLDGAEYEHVNSFYFEEVTVRGRPMTFVRYYNRPGLRRPVPGLQAVVGSVIASEARGQVKALAKEAARRHAKPKP